MIKVNCKECDKEFFTYDAWLRRGRGKFCSRFCARKNTWKFEAGPSYWTIHQWLAKNFGKANMCEGEQCNGKSKVYDWALKKGKDYEKNRDNFINLCRSCHKKYDFIKFRLNVRERFLLKL